MMYSEVVRFIKYYNKTHFYIETLYIHISSQKQPYRIMILYVKCTDTVSVDRATYIIPCQQWNITHWYPRHRVRNLDICPLGEKKNSIRMITHLTVRNATYMNSCNPCIKSVIYPLLKMKLH